MTWHYSTYAERPDLFQQARVLNPSVWPEFMLNDPVADRLWDYLDQDFAAYQSMLCDDAGTVVAVGNVLPLVWDGTRAGMPAGWDDAFERAVAGWKAGRQPNTLSAVQVTVDKRRQGQGLSRWVLRAMKYAAARHGFTTLIAPVRPTLKAQYPLTPMERYITWQHADGRLFDPWLRVHQSLGAELISVCPESMRIPGTVKQWEAWTEMRFPESGVYVVPGALTPVTIDCERDLGEYVEPNVWMRHAVTPADLDLEKTLP
jgi:GNAT superfamily N-acetyltransferase